jgi:tRNA 2-selenouridine synthase
MTITLDEFLKLRHQLPAVDVRSEGEYTEGHIRGVVNIPILNNEERIAVGTDYKQKGQREAIFTGFRLVGPRLGQIVYEAEQLAKNSEMLVHCWRGGMRSNNFCQFINMVGIKSHQLIGGYKAYRQRAVESFELPFQLMVIGGKTGSGKSEVLRQIQEEGEQILDLERLANHKGSVFGGLMMGVQPTTEQFQNELFEEILKLDYTKRIWVEDESIAIGKIFLPDAFWRSLRNGPVFRIDVSKEIRTTRLVKEYGHADQQEFLAAMEKILRKLGGQYFQIAKERWLAGDAFSTIDVLLNYYDRAYANGLESRVNIVSPAIAWDGVNASACARNLIQSANELSGRA